MSVEIIDQEIINPSINGMEYGGKPRLLARSPEHILVWISGYTTYTRVSGSVYCPTEMVAIDRTSRKIINICEGQRLSKALFVDNAIAIDKIFGDGAHLLLEKNKTVVFQDCKPWSISGNEIPINPNMFGYAVHIEKQKIRERLVANGITDEVIISFTVEKEYIEAHKNDLTFKERQAIWYAKCAVENAKKPKMFTITFSEEEINFLRDHFEMANDPTAQSIIAKLGKV